MSTKTTRTEKSFYRRLYLAYLIESGVNTIPKIIEATGWERNTIVVAKSALSDFGISVERMGAKKDGFYIIKDWGVWIEKDTVSKNAHYLKSILEI